MTADTSTTSFAKLGPGPFRFIDLIGPEDFVMAGDNPFEGIEGDQSKCEHCGSRLSWRAIVEDANGQGHVVGRTCASRAMDLTGVALRALEVKAKRGFITKWMSSEDGAEFRKWCATQPHPKGWASKSLLSDLQYWIGRDGIKNMSKIRKALKAFGKGDCTELLAEEVAAQAHRLEKAQARYFDNIKVAAKAALKSERAKTCRFAIFIEMCVETCDNAFRAYRTHKDQARMEAEVDAALAESKALQAKLREQGHVPFPTQARTAEIDAWTQAEAWAFAESKGWVRGSFVPKSSPVYYARY